VKQRSLRQGGGEQTEKTWNDREQHLASADVNADGSFSFEGIPPGILYVLYVTKDRSSTAKFPSPKVSPGQEVQVREQVLRLTASGDDGLFE